MDIGPLRLQAATFSTSTDDWEKNTGEGSSDDDSGFTISETYSKHLVTGVEGNYSPLHYYAAHTTEENWQEYQLEVKNGQLRNSLNSIVAIEYSERIEERNRSLIIVDQKLDLMIVGGLGDVRGIARNFNDFARGIGVRGAVAPRSGFNRDGLAMSFVGAQLPGSSSRTTEAIHAEPVGFERVPLATDNSREVNGPGVADPGGISVPQGNNLGVTLADGSTLLVDAAYFNNVYIPGRQALSENYDNALAWAEAYDAEQRRIADARAQQEEARANQEALNKIWGGILDNPDFQRLARQQQQRRADEQLLGSGAPLFLIGLSRANEALENTVLGAFGTSREEVGVGVVQGIHATLRDAGLAYNNATPTAQWIVQQPGFTYVENGVGALANPTTYLAIGASARFAAPVRVASPSGLRQVSRWGRPGLQPGDFVQLGPPTRFNYILTGKWQPGFGNQYAPFRNGERFFVPSEQIVWPSGWGVDGRWKGLFGQRIYIGAGPE